MRIFDRLFSKKKSLVQDTIANTISNDYTTHATQRVFDTITNADLLPLAAQRLKNVAPEISQGHLFEIDQAAKFCKDAIKKNSTLFARTTESLGMPHDPADILISNGKETLKKYQAKSSHSAASTIRMLKDKKYDGMGRVGGSEAAWHRRKHRAAFRRDFPSLSGAGGPVVVVTRQGRGAEPHRRRRGRPRRVAPLDGLDAALRPGLAAGGVTDAAGPVARRGRGSLRAAQDVLPRALLAHRGGGGGRGGGGWLIAVRPQAPAASSSR